MAFTYRKQTVEGLTFRVGRSGAGAPHDALPLLMLNGIGFNAELMEPFARQFGNRPVICPDMPGSGLSPDPVLPYTISRMARAMVALMEREFPGRRFDVLGFSWGGAVAQQIAVTAPRKMERLALVATTSGLPLPVANPEVLRRLFDPVEYIDPNKLSENFHALLHEGGATSGLLRRFRTPTPQGVGCQIGALAGWTAAPLLPFARMPVLLTGMVEDIIVPIAHQRALACLIPHARTVEIAAGNHLLPLAVPTKVVPQIVSFFEDTHDAYAY